MKTLSLLLLFSQLLCARLNIVTSYPYIADLTSVLSGELAQVRSLSKGYFDPHFIVPKPSHIGKIKQADLLIKNGAELEMGWLTPLIERANNGDLHILDLSQEITLIEVPQILSRDLGDIHAKGNPHFHLDPYNILIVAQNITKQLKILDPDHQNEYEKKYLLFISQWKANLQRWETSMKRLKGAQVITYHKLFNYFFNRFDIHSIIEIEALPGITPSSGHIQKVIALAKEHAIKKIITDVYHSQKIPNFIASQCSAKVIILPHDIGAIESLHTLAELFDMLSKELLDD